MKHRNIISQISSSYQDVLIFILSYDFIMERVCSVCFEKVNGWKTFIQHCEAIHPLALVTHAVREHYVDQVMGEWWSVQQAQPIEWLSNEPARIPELAIAFGGNDPSSRVWAGFDLKLAAGDVDFEFSENSIVFLNMIRNVAETLYGEPEAMATEEDMGPELSAFMNGLIE